MYNNQRSGSMGQEILRNGLKPSVVKGLSSRGGGI